MDENPQVAPMAVPMMTLSALAATAPDPRPSGESIAAHEQRILAGINAQLQQLGSTWSANWLVLSPDRANLAFIAADSATPSFAVVLRGTQFDSLVDLGEDMDVGTLALFTVGGSPPVLISQGAMDAFTAIADSTSGSGTGLVEELRAQFSRVLQGLTPNLYVTGHSLGGCMATTLALYLAAQTWQIPPASYVYTFAAPTAGLQAFADLFDKTFAGQSWRFYNAWDAVPNAWASLQTVINGFYPSPGPGQIATIHGLLKKLAEGAKNNVYVQTNQKSGTIVLNNSSYPAGLYDKNATCTTVGDFLAQVAFQHANDTYLALMNAAAVPEIAPSVVAVGPNAGPMEGGVEVLVGGTNFAIDSVVDFGPIPGTEVTVLSPHRLTVRVPALAGTVDVRVTTLGGTSAAVPSAQFTAPEPTSPPTVTLISPYLGQDPNTPGTPSALSPLGGPVQGGTPVTIYGTGFVTDLRTEVRFGTQIGLHPRSVSLTEMTVFSPPQRSTGTCDVTVKNRLGRSSVSPAGKFTIGLPFVGKLDPCCGPAKATGQYVKILGSGFVSGSMVKFGKGGAAKTVIYKSDSELWAIPPNVTIVGGIDDLAVDVTVSSDGGKTYSALTLKDVYTFYPG